MKKFISLILSVLMMLGALSCISTVAFAADTEVLSGDMAESAYSGARTTYNGGYGEEIGAIQIMADGDYCFSHEEFFYLIAEEEGEYRFYTEDMYLDTYIDIYTDGGSYYFDDDNDQNFDGTVYLSAGETITGKIGIRCEDPAMESVTLYVYYQPDDEEDYDSLIGTTIYSEDFNIEVVSKDTCIVTNINEDDEEISIPSEIEGYKVVGLSEYLWGGNEMEKISLPYSIETLSSDTFWCYSRLRRISISSKNKNFKSVDGIVFTKDGEKIVAIPKDFRGTVTIPAGTKKLSSEEWRNLKKAERVSVASDHPVMVKEGGIIYNKEFTKIYYGRPTSKNYEMKNTVKVIEVAAFEGCENLESVKFSSKVTDIAYATFAGCAALETVTLPKGLVSIGEAAFMKTGVKSIKLPSTTKTVGDESFDNCKSLNKIVLNEGLRDIGAYCFKNTAVEQVALPDTLEKTGYGIFMNCKKLSQVDLGSGLTELMPLFFSDCKSLKQIEFPKNIKSLWGNVFSGSGLTSVKIPSNVKTVHETFRNCDNLKSVYIGKGVSSLSCAFQNCDNLESVKFADGFDGYCIWTFEGCPKLKNVTIPSSVTQLAYKEFANCTSLNEIDIPSSVLKVDKWSVYETGWLNSQKRGVIYLDHVLYGYKNSKNTETVPKDFRLGIKTGTTSVATIAFENQKNLIDVIIPDGMKYIGEYAFNNCKNLKSVEIPESVKTIEDCAFGYIFKNVYYEEWGYSSQEFVVDPDFVIYGVPGSTAEKYADENGITFKKACAHKSTKWIVDEEATVYQAGSKHKICTTCKRWLKIAEIDQLECSKPALKAVTATANGVKVTWGKVKGGDSYRVYRKVKSSDWKYLDTVNGTTFTDKTAKSGNTYYYTVRAKNEAGLGGYDKSGESVKYVAAPKLSKIQNVAGGLNITWSKVSGADGYYVYRKVYGADSWSRIATIKNGSTVTYKDTKVSGGKVYVYTVKAYDGSVKSAHDSDGIKLRYLATPALKSVASGTSGIKFTWGKVAGAEGYYVYRKTTGGWQRIATVEGNTYYLDKTAKKGTTYTYTVKAFNDSAYSYYNTKGLTITDKY